MEEFGTGFRHRGSGVFGGKNCGNLLGEGGNTYVKARLRQDGGIDIFE